MTAPIFIQFTESNESEGEEWSFWLQYTGNEEAIGNLRDLLDEAEENYEYEFDYVLTHNIEPESVVDKLVEYATVGYMASHQKVVGKLVCPDSLGDGANDLYKGQIKAHFKAAAE